MPGCKRLSGLDPKLKSLFKGDVAAQGRKLMNMPGTDTGTGKCNAMPKAPGQDFPIQEEAASTESLALIAGRNRPPHSFTDGFLKWH